MPKIKGPDLGRRTAAAIAAEIAALDAEHAPRLAMLEADRAARPALVEAGDVDAIEAHDAKVHRAETETEVHTARRARLVAEHQAAEQAEAHTAEQAKRQAAYDEARTAADEAARIYGEDYPRLAREIAALLIRAGRARNLVKAANAALPDGFGPISTDFEPSRGRPGTEARSEPAFKEVRRSRSTGRELLTYASGDPDVEVVKVPAGFRHHPFVPAVPHVPLSADVILPGVAWGDPWFWPAPAAPSHEGR
ncbi:hypothetical protein D8770_27525 [Methylobacterium sp. DB1607]|nr:hypothetical protein [Methylobacterium sp. DB1607]